MSHQIATMLLQGYMNFLILYSNGPFLQSIWDWAKPKNLIVILFMQDAVSIQNIILRLAGVRVTSYGFHLTPAAFSFGWPGFVLAALIAGVRGKPTMGLRGEGIQVVNVDEGKVSNNQSWLVGSLYDGSEKVRMKQANEILKRRQKDINTSGRTEKTTTPAADDDKEEISLLIDVLTTEPNRSQTTPISYLWWLCWAIIPFQLLIASIPYKRHNDTSTLIITISGIILSIITSSIPQWTQEKWPAGHIPEKKSKTVILTRGKARRYIMLIHCEEGSIDLDSTAISTRRTSWWTCLALLIVTTCWMYLPYQIAMMQGNRYYIGVIGLVGWMQNLSVGLLSSTTPDELNVHLHRSEERLSITTYIRKSQREHVGFWKTSGKPKETPIQIEARHARTQSVLQALIELEKHYKSAGTCLFPILFPDPIEDDILTALTEEEKQFLDTATAAAATASTTKSDVDG